MIKKLNYNIIFKIQKFTKYGRMACIALLSFIRRVHMIGYTTEIGKIQYSDEVIANIIGMATMECYGVVGMAAKNTGDELWELIKIEHLNKGVKVACKDGELNIEVFVVVEYGTKISVIANNIIQKVRYNVENFTGLKVTGITVNIEGVRF